MYRAWHETAGPGSDGDPLLVVDPKYLAARLQRLALDELFWARRGERHHVIQFSGGAGSFWAAKKVVDRVGPANVTLLFADTLIEDQDLYIFLGQTSMYLGAKLEVIRDGRTPFQVFKDRRFLGNSRIDPCSRILKREICYKWIKDNFLPDAVALHVGIDWTEERRMKNVRTVWQPYVVHAPLVCDLTFDKDSGMDKLRQLGIRVPRLYTLGMPHNNCGGGCVKAGKAHFLKLLEVLPERYAEWEKNEKDVSLYLQSLYPDRPMYTILKERVNKEERYISLEQLRVRSQEIRNTEEGQLEWGGCGCALDVSEEELEEARAR